MYQTVYYQSKFLSEIVDSNNDYFHLNENGQNALFQPYVWQDWLLEYFLDIGLDINIKDINGKTPLYYCDEKEAFLELIFKGANINSVDNKGRNLLFFKKNKDIIEMILKMNIDLNKKDNDGYNFIAYETFSEFPDLIMEKKDKIKKDVAIKNIYLESPYSWYVLIKNGFTLKHPKKLEFIYDPNKNHRKLKEALHSMETFFPQKIKECEFHFKGDKGLYPKTYTFNDLYKLDEI